MATEQPWLIPYKNPLVKRFGAEFFRSVPKRPGVYMMLGSLDSVLYVGKAKDLRTRLGSYRRARPDQVSRKVIRMINIAQRIVWEECADEGAALLRENALIRLHRPPFNVVNTNPESYYFLALRWEAPHLQFCLTTNPEGPDGPAGEASSARGALSYTMYGAFKGRGRVRDGYAALLRLLWICHAEIPQRFEFPGNLVKRAPAYQYRLKLAEHAGGTEARKWARALERFLAGTSQVFLSLLTASLLEIEGIPAFMYHFIQEDLESLRAFYELGPKRNRKLRRVHGLTVNLIAQDQLDDLLVGLKHVPPNSRRA